MRRLLVNPDEGKDACGVGFLASLHNEASRDLMEKVFLALKNLAHRGAIDADGKTGDGAGVLTPIPKQYYIDKAAHAGIDLNAHPHFAVAMIFYPTQPRDFTACKSLVEDVLKKYGIATLWNRPVPVDETILGQKAFSVKPRIRQKFLACPPDLSLDQFEQKLYLIRKEIEVILHDQSYTDFYIPSLSTKTIVHKGLFMGEDLKRFYGDLSDINFKAPFAVFHQRFSTNTFPSWQLAQPFRMMAHNGEINTIRGNRNWMQARENADQARSWVPKDFAMSRFMMSGRSDSASFDNALEAYIFGGRSILHAIVHMLPEAWQNKKNIDPDVRAFYEYHACLSECWDGPAAITFTDGNIVGTILDRNGLRPARYKITKDYVCVCSEVGCVDFAVEDIIENGKLSPGTLIAVNVKRKKVLKNSDIKFSLADRRNYQDWVNHWVYTVDEEVMKKGLNVYDEKPFLSDNEAFRYKKIFGYTQEDEELILKPMFATKDEPVGSMGDDTPLAVFSTKPRLLYTYFKQLFAQVTNPPIDPIRERTVTSLRMYLGKSGNVFEETPAHAHQLRVRGPIVTGTVFSEIKACRVFSHAVLVACFPSGEGPKALEDALLELCLAAEKAVDDGHALLILSDRFVDKQHAPIPMLLAVGAVHHHLRRVGKRVAVSLLVETGEARETHHFACLIGFGASVIYPYLALKEANTHGGQAAVAGYIEACEKGILKTMSKMGISVLQSYHASQLFEVIGLKDSLVKGYFTGTPCKVSGIDLTDIAADALFWHREAFVEGGNKVLDIGGFYRFRREGEYHAFNPDVVRFLHKAVVGNDFAAYRKYCDLINRREPMTLRDLMALKKGKAIPVTEVESKENILKRFCTPGISYGAISQETHETMAIAMNRIGAKSDSGEGGEDPGRFPPLENGDSKNSAIKQVASARFGVTGYYLSQARELEIKIAQGAKPGEGGQLPGHKVSADIARIRHSTPGVTLISPAPHHDIYSIEDLSQLIYDLKQASPKAKVGVKLVAEDGVGTIAAGVAKAHADVILISGHDGGTGASPLSSIKHAGVPWELGLAEAQQVLVRNKLRERVILRVDGGLKTGRDVVVAALLGAEEFAFGTASLVALGCVMVRQCHLNTCPVGVATQDPELRKKYTGTPERVIQLFTFIAEEVRLLLATMGFKTLDDIIGRAELLTVRKDCKNPKAKKLNLKKILARADGGDHEPRRHSRERNDWENDFPLDDKLISDCAAVLKTGGGDLHLNYDITNSHRSIGAKLSYEIVTRLGASGLTKGRVVMGFKGTSGQSFGAFAARGLEFHLEGEANDYVGKGLSGAVVSLRPPRAARFRPELNVICGNTCLYGATSGELYVNGRAGERFAVRNSGAMAVVEGVGDHGCEYMTGGSVLILGPVGDNFAAGMTGGTACVYDPHGALPSVYNADDVELMSVDWDAAEGKVFYNLLTAHLSYTDSPLARRILRQWKTEGVKFLTVWPKEILKLTAKLSSRASPS